MSHLTSRCSPLDNEDKTPKCRHVKIHFDFFFYSDFFGRWEEEGGWKPGAVGATCRQSFWEIRNCNETRCECCLLNCVLVYPNGGERLHALEINRRD